MDAIRLTGGCQCGAVRYAAHEMPRNASICHCRMCQKQVGSYVAPWADVDRDKFEVTRGVIAHFESSAGIRRGFCRDCGTPLTFEDGRDRFVEIALGTLDDPAAVPPERQTGVEGRLPFFGALPDLPADPPTEEKNSEGAARIRRSSRQHPDHDTDTWPLAGPPAGAPEDVSPMHDGP